jgi:hypothetical protein
MRNIRTISTRWAELEVGSMFGAYLQFTAPKRHLVWGIHLARRSSVTSDVIIRDGQIDCDRLRKAHMSGGDLKEDLRSAGVADVRDVLEARLERSGELSVIKKKTP